MKIREITEGVGRITKQNQTHDVGPDEVTKQAAKFGNKVDKDGRPPTLSKKVKGSSTNVMFNLGMTENFAKDSTTAIKLIKKYHQTGDEQDAFAAIKHGWNFIKNPKIRSIIVNIVKKVSTEGGYPEWNDTVAYIKKNTGIDVSNVNENFADGKKPGRKGLAKRSGVNTKASVSSLRKTAKNSTGEKQRMAHWLANMKAGRKKKK